MKDEGQHPTPQHSTPLNTSIPNPNTMLRTLLTLSALSALIAFLVGAAPRMASSDPELTEATGTVITFVAQLQQLSVNTRLGPITLLLDSKTLVLLNNHSASTTDIRAGDKVTVRYRFDTSVASVVHLFRQQKRSGRITNVTTTAIEMQVDGAALSFRTDAQSRVELEDIPLVTRSVLIGRKATAVFEPGSLLLLSMQGAAQRATGSVGSVNVEARTVTLSGRKPRTLTLDSAATVRRNGETAEIASLVTGDRVVAAFVKEGATLRTLALQARGTASE